MSAPVFTLGQLAERLGATLRGAADKPIRGLATLQDAGPDQLSFLANADSAGLVLGARVPAVLTSRADSVRARLASAAVAVRLAHARRTGAGGAA